MCHLSLKHSCRIYISWNWKEELALRHVLHKVCEYLCLSSWSAKIINLTNYIAEYITFAICEYPDRIFMGQKTMNLSKLCSKENQELGEHKHWEEGASRAGALTGPFFSESRASDYPVPHQLYRDQTVPNNNVPRELKGRWLSVISRSAWSTGVPGQLRLKRPCLNKTKKRKTNNKE